MYKSKALNLALDSSKKRARKKQSEASLKTNSTEDFSNLDNSKVGTSVERPNKLLAVAIETWSQLLCRVSCLRFGINERVKRLSACVVS